MIGLVLVTHGRLAKEFRVAMEHVVGPQEAIETICIGPDDDMEVAPRGYRRRGGAGRRRVGRHPAHRPVRRHAVQSRHLAAAKPARSR